ncbi:MAG: O-antigen ligase family protein [Halanaerobiales bacterium]|nr:O-antigen ligase family protein [Halanaerobiales bacterium]
MRFKRLKKVNWDKINLYFWLGLFLTGVISTIGAYNKSIALSSFLIPFVFVWLYIIGKYMIDNPVLFIKDMVKGTVILAAITVIIRFFSLEIVYNGFEVLKGTGRASVLGLGDNGLGILFQAGIIASLGLLFVEKGKRAKILNVLYILIVISGLIITDSRGSLVGTAVGSLILSVFVSYKIIGLLSSLVIFSLIINNDYYQRVISIFSLENRYNDMRLKVYQGTLNMIKDHPLFGVGPGNFLSVYPKYKLPGETINAMSPHSNYLNIISGWGIIGGLFFFGWIFYTIIKNIIGIDNNYKKILIAVLIGFWAHVVFNDLATAYAGILMGLIDNKNIK